MKVIPMKKYSYFPLCLGILLAVLAGVTIASAQRNRNGFGNNGTGNDNGNGNGNGNGFGNRNGFGNNGNGNGFGNRSGFGRNNGFGNNNNVPASTNYSAFAGFIFRRNIFNPDRFAINTSQVIRTNRGPQTIRGPEFQLVGTMSYEKGMFAFFDGNNNNYRKVLSQSDSNSIAGYTVAKVTTSGVQLQSTDKKRTLTMNIGQGMRQNNGVWQLVNGQGDLSTSTGGVFGAVPGTTESAAPAESSAPSPALEGNAILKRLMEQRQKQLGN
jgi:hypothetical protein